MSSKSRPEAADGPLLLIPRLPVREDAPYRSAVPLMTGARAFERIAHRERVAVAIAKQHEFLDRIRYRHACRSDVGVRARNSLNTATRCLCVWMRDKPGPFARQIAEVDGG